MSVYEWQHGTIKLPSAEYARFRQHIQAVDQRQKEAIFDLTQEFWKSLTRKQQTNLNDYRKALAAWSLSKQPRDRHGFNDESEVLTAARMTLEPFQTEQPQRILRGAAQFPTNRTTVFGNLDATITFEAHTKSVTWDVAEGNHACETARDSALGKAFFGLLDTIRWTRGTGGVIVGNDEMNQEADYPGGGANYVTAAYGYAGIAEAPEHVRPFRNARGQQVRVKITPGRYEMVGKELVDQ